MSLFGVNGRMRFIGYLGIAVCWVSLVAACKTSNLTTGDGTARQPVRTYTYGRDLISRRTITGGLVEFYSADALGTTRFKTGFDQGTHATVNGSLGELTTQTFNYDAFGQLVGGNPTDTEYAFTGEEWDSHVGAYYLRARWYRPDWGRFLSRDTYEGDVEEPISQNRFLYGAANPVLFVDPSGHMSGSLSETIDVTAIQKTLSGHRNVSQAKAMNKVRRTLCRVGGSQAVHHLVPLAMGGMGTRGKNAEDLLLGYASSMNKYSHQGLHSIINMLLKDSVGMPGNTSKLTWENKFDKDSELQRKAYQSIYDAVRYMDLMCKATKGYNPMVPDLERVLKLLGYRVLNRKVVAI